MITVAFICRLASASRCTVALARDVSQGPLRPWVQAAIQKFLPQP